LALPVELRGSASPLERAGVSPSLPDRGLAGGLGPFAGPKKLARPGTAGGRLSFSLVTKEAEGVLLVCLSLALARRPLGGGV